MDPKSQGTGMTEEDAAALRINDLPEFMEYMKNTFKASEEYITTLSDEDLAAEKDIPGMGTRGVADVIGGMTMSHHSSHLGEISYLKGLMGMDGGGH
jgi:hypothetical protein